MTLQPNGSVQSSAGFRLTPVLAPNHPLTRKRARMHIFGSRAHTVSGVLAETLHVCWIFSRDSPNIFWQTHREVPNMHACMPDGSSCEAGMVERRMFFPRRKIARQKKETTWLELFPVCFRAPSSKLFTLSSGEKPSVWVLDFTSVWVQGEIRDFSLVQGKKSGHLSLDLSSELQIRTHVPNQGRVKLYEFSCCF